MSVCWCHVAFDFYHFIAVSLPAVICSGKLQGKNNLSQFLICACSFAIVWNLWKAVLFPSQKANEEEVKSLTKPKLAWRHCSPSGIHPSLSKHERIERSKGNWQRKQTHAANKEPDSPAYGSCFASMQPAAWVRLIIHLLSNSCVCLLDWNPYRVIGWS